CSLTADRSRIGGARPYSRPWIGPKARYHTRSPVRLVDPPPAPPGASRTRAGVGGAEAQGRTHGAVVTMKQLLESGVHFGHQARRWSPTMKRSMLMQRNGIDIIDLQPTL